MLPLAVATSIDALAVGVTFAFLRVEIGPAVSCIGVITFLLSAAGVYIWRSFGDLLQAKRSLPAGDPGPDGEQDPAGASGVPWLRERKTGSILVQGSIMWYSGPDSGAPRAV